MARPTKKDTTPSKLDDKLVSAENDASTSHAITAMYGGRLEAAYRVQLGNKNLISMSNEIAWARAKIADDISACELIGTTEETIKEFNTRFSDLKYEMKECDDPVITKAFEKFESAVDEMRSMQTIRATEDRILDNITKMANLISVETRRIKLMEAAPTQQEWELAKKLLVQSFHSALLGFSTSKAYLHGDKLSATDRELIWQAVMAGMSSANISEPQDMATLRFMKERNEQ